MDYWAWAVILVIVTIALVAMEMFIPSGGVLGFLAVCSIVSAIILGFLQSPTVGMIILVGTIIGLPVVIILALKWWPRTPIGRRVLLGPRRKEEVVPDDPRRRTLQELVGRIGRAKTKMLPSGLVVVDGHRRGRRGVR